MAEIIRLNLRRAGRGSVRCEPLGLSFPVVYRLTGCAWQEDMLVGDERYQYTEYTLSDEPVKHLANVTITPITHLETSLDSGWVIVRHHASEMEGVGYLHGIHDVGEHDVLCSQVVFRNDDGLFTIVHRPVPLAGCQNHLLVYEAIIPWEGFEPWNSWTKVITSTSEVADEAIMYPPETES